MYLILQSTYTMTGIALCDKGHIIDEIWIDNKVSSKLLIPETNQLLQKHNVFMHASYFDKLSMSETHSNKSFSQAEPSQSLHFIGAYQGPAPFTSLRTVIATSNGIAFACGIPLVGINGLEVLVRETQAQTNMVIALLNAFCDDVYYAVYDKQENTIVTGCLHIDECLQLLQEKIQNNFTAVGNGVLLHQEKLKQAFGLRIIIPEIFQEFATLEGVAAQAYKDFCRGNSHQQLMPLYLKQYSAIIKY